MSIFHLSTSSRNISGTIKLDGSKSISNRVLIIRALSQDSFAIHNLSTSDDTKTLHNLLESTPEEYHCGHAGTTYRFLTAYLSVSKDGRSLLTGSNRMKQRPIEPLVTALKSIGADISYMEEEGYPPLDIGPFDPSKYVPSVSIRGDMSSQYISALLMIAPTLPMGLTVTINGELVSRPYIEMTISIMAHFGIKSEWQDNQTLTIAPQPYQPKPFTVESDWSAASYYYSIAAFAESADIRLLGLFEKSTQGDQAIASIGTKLGIVTTYIDNGIQISKSKNAEQLAPFEYDFIKAPDIAQTVAVIAGGLGIEAIFTGLQTLKIKETDRITALKQELEKVGVYFTKLPSKFSQKSNTEYYMIGGKASSESLPTFTTYKDHRMAMAFAPLALLLPIAIEKPEVVSKSYPAFWSDFEALGLEIER